MRIVRWGSAAAAVLTAAAGTLLAPSAVAHDARQLAAIGLTIDGNQIVRFATDRPADVEQIGLLTGLPPQPPIPLPVPPTEDTALVGIDYRVANGRLYGVGNRGGVFLIDEQTAAVTEVGNLGVTLDGRLFGVDFNPAADALRVVSDTGQNLRQPMAAGGDGLGGATVSDAPLNYDGALAKGVTGAAYTGNDLSPLTGTRLFDIDNRNDLLARQDPPNAGTLTAVGEPGSLGDIGPYSGFDVHSTLDGSGVTVRDEAFALVADDHDLRLLEIDLADGGATAHGVFRRPVLDLAIVPNQG